MPEITFDAPTHTYRVDGRPVPSVTTILSAFDRSLARIPAEVLARKGRIGTAVHRACELDDAGKLDESTLHDLIRPYVAIWRRFRAEVPFEIEQNEQWVYNDLHSYIGTADRIVRFDSARSVLDIKSGIKSPWHALQTAAYAAAAERGGGDAVTRRFCVHLLPDKNTYHLVEHTVSSDRGTFLGAVALYHFMNRHGELNER